MQKGSAVQRSWPGAHGRPEADPARMRRKKQRCSTCTNSAPICLSKDENPALWRLISLGVAGPLRVARRSGEGRSAALDPGSLARNLRVELVFVVHAPKPRRRRSWLTIVLLGDSVFDKRSLRSRISRRRAPASNPSACREQGDPVRRRRHVPVTWSANCGTCPRTRRI